MPPVLIAGGIAAAGAIGGAALSAKAQKKAANKAADTSLQVANQNNALTKEIYGQNKETLSPFVNTGTQASGQINALLQNGPYDGGNINSAFVNSAMNPGSLQNFQDSTGYQFRLGEGIDALNTGYAARGALQSGAAMKDIVRFGQDFASNEYQNYLRQLDRYTSYSDQFANQERAYDTDRFNEHMGFLGNQQGVGLAAGSALAGVGQNYVNTISANNNSAGTVAANAALAQGAANANMYAGAGNALGQFAGLAYGGGAFGQPGGGANAYGMYGAGNIY